MNQHEDELEKLELKIDALIDNLQLDLNQLVMKHKSTDEPEFQKELVLLIGANSREASEIVIKAYKDQRQKCLNRLVS